MLVHGQFTQWKGLSKGTLCRDECCSAGLARVAGEAKLFRKVKKQANYEEDFSMLSERATNGQRQFSVSKCKVMHFGIKTLEIGEL